MISAIVLCADVAPDGRDAQEIVVRSLSWLVTAVIAGVVRDVILSAPPELDIEAIADRVGCEVIQAESEAGRLQASAARAKCPRVLVVKAGFQPDGMLVEEIDARDLAPLDETAAVLAVPQTFVERLFPNLSPVVGILASKTKVQTASGFGALVRASKGAPRLTTRARPIF